ncbi:MAG: phosphatase [Clostridiales bacterium]|nr:phosphatase [Clostridiales bacterium]
MKTVADLHTHTLASQHAYSTIMENIRSAKEKGLCAVGITDHCPRMPDGATSHHFYCLAGLPKQVMGVQLFRGAEADIVDFQGSLDLDGKILDRLDFVVASYHAECISPGNEMENTRGMIAAIRNSQVDCIGHCGNPLFPVNIPAIVSACVECHTLIEINSNSFTVRPGSHEICREVALECMRQRAPVVISSDAHFCTLVGEHSAAIRMLNGIQFPEELIINSSEERFFRYFPERVIIKEKREQNYV